MKQKENLDSENLETQKGGYQRERVWGGQVGERGSESQTGNGGELDFGRGKCSYGLD